MFLLIVFANDVIVFYEWATKKRDMKPNYIIANKHIEIDVDVYVTQSYSLRLDTR